jgi:GDP-4-dehydro-6-deoxy-D-mannose reductase
VRVLITGASGFAGNHLARLCAREGDEVIGVSRTGSVPDGAGEGVVVDLRNTMAVRAIVRAARPEVVYHLAALSSVGRSWDDPATTLSDNGAGALAVLEAVRHEAAGARVVWVSTCEVYGALGPLPVSEDAPLAPANPYAVSKTAGELLAAVYAAAYGLEVIRARPFNHTGPGQRSIFILSSLARQAAEGRLAGVSELRIVTGNPDTRRDFTDVRDVVRAYRLLARGAAPWTRGATPATQGAAPAIYNVCTGRSVSAREQVQLLAELIAPVKVDHVVDRARVRAHEVMDFRGSHERLTKATGWRPLIPLRQTMLETIQWWESELAGSGVSSPGS